jgi:hypothetical protein
MLYIIIIKEKNITLFLCGSVILQLYYRNVAFLLQICYNKNVLKLISKEEVIKMTTIFIVLYILIFAIFALIAYAILQIKLFGMNVKDFWSFIQANQILDKLYAFAKHYQSMSAIQQVMYLSEAEKVFDAFEKVPGALWEEEYEKYNEVLSKYKDIKMLRWAESH